MGYRLKEGDPMNFFIVEYRCRGGGGFPYKGNTPPPLDSGLLIHSTDQSQSTWYMTRQIIHPTTSYQLVCRLFNCSHYGDYRERY